MDIFTHLYIFLAMIEPFFASPYDGPFLVLSRKDICPSEIYRSVKNIMPPHISPEVCRAYNQPYLQILRGIPQKNFVEEAYQPNTVINKKKILGQIHSAKGWAVEYEHLLKAVRLLQPHNFPDDPKGVDALKLPISLRQWKLPFLPSTF